MTDLFTICKNALDSMGESPKSLGKALSAISGLNDLDTAVTSDDFFDLLKGEDTNEPIAILFHERLASWDYASSPPWGEGSDRNTTLRRRAIYRTLSLTVDQQNLCDARFPYAPALDPPILIAGSENSGWRPWYTPQRASARKFYWKSYFGYLRDTKHWEAKNLAALDESTNDVIARLTDPEQQVPYQSKGLVVGFVQSGKTANFTGVIARAADAGYRLFIVLAGTINILRDQTQRRIDKELIGTDMCQDEQYELDEDYSEFVSHNGFPSERQAFDWERLTGSKEDFKRLKKGISALEFRRFDSSKPFFNPGNLHRDRAKLAVVKKNTTVLDKLIADLKSVGRKVDLSAVPALVIDDESDQASVNTVNAFQYRQRGKLEKERKARSETNNRIVTLLKTLPRAQYVGYTATPFANVFVDPEDAEDLFPSDFIVSLPRPEGYMGVREFYDDVEPQKGDYSSNQNAFVRFIEGPDEKAENLVQAIDAFVLSGAIKLYRSSRSGGKLSY
ncbi:MAG TPA: endonuclease, partial [Candidatus Angelobacter sp.]|nr:endonuclease [Candidatus Angelobacter sp.]